MIKRFFSNKRNIYVLVGLLLFAQAIALLSMGQPAICKCGYIKLWHGLTMSSENSQHISDWYTFSHIIHGFIFYWIFWKVGKRWPWGARLLMAILVEGAWELLENTDMVINRYREVTISLDYFGDSILNSVMDTVWMIFGFILAGRLPVWITLALIAIMEVGVGLVIRDNLTLNVVMLLYPFEFIKKWQSGL